MSPSSPGLDGPEMSLERTQLSRLSVVVPGERVQVGKQLLLASSLRTRAQAVHAKGRSLGCWLHSNPGKEFEKLGRVEKDGLLTIKGTTCDGFWLKVDCGRAEGWVQSPKVDRVLDRPIYSLYDNTRVMVHPTHAGLSQRTTTLVTVRNAPNWAAASLANLPIHTPIHVLSYLRDFSWVEIELFVGAKCIIGWVPYDSTSLPTTLPKTQRRWALLPSSSSSSQVQSQSQIPMRKEQQTKLERERDHKVDNAIHIHDEATESKTRQQPTTGNTPTLRALKLREQLLKKIAKKTRTRHALHVLFDWELHAAFREWRHATLHPKPVSPADTLFGFGFGLG